jgi:hypothetical protein
MRTSENAQNANFALQRFSEVPHSPDPMRQGFLCKD